LGFPTIRGTQTIDDKVDQSTFLSAANRNSNNEALGRIETYSCVNMHSSAGSMRSLDRIAGSLSKLEERFSSALSSPRLHLNENLDSFDLSPQESDVLTRSNLSRRSSLVASVKDFPFEKESSPVHKIPRRNTSAATHNV